MDNEKLYWARLDSSRFMNMDVKWWDTGKKTKKSDNDLEILRIIPLAGFGHHFTHYSPEHLQKAMSEFELGLINEPTHILTTALEKKNESRIISEFKLEWESKKSGLTRQKKSQGARPGF